MKVKNYLHTANVADALLTCVLVYYGAYAATNLGCVYQISSLSYQI